MNVLVTGATGFVGANLVQLMNDLDWQPRVLRRASSSMRALEGMRYESALGDISDAASIGPACAGVEVVFHIAAALDYWRIGRDKLYAINVQGTRNVLESAINNGVRRVVFTSSVGALGLPAWRQCADESHDFNLQPEEFYYGHSKYLAERICREYAARGLEVIVVNPGLVIGPRDVNLGTGSFFVELNKHSIPLYPAGGVNVVDVAEVAAAHIAAARIGCSGERYILGGNNLWYKEILSTIAQVVGRPAPRVRLPRWVGRLKSTVDFAHNRLGLKLPFNGEHVRFANETLWFDSTKAQRKLGLSTRPFADTAERAWKWYCDHGLIQPH